MFASSVFVCYIWGSIHPSGSLIEADRSSVYLMNIFHWKAGYPSHFGEFEPLWGECSHVVDLESVMEGAHFKSL